MKSIETVLAFKEGKIPMGLGIGVAEVDKFLSWKPNNFSVTLARDNVGKTFFKLWYYCVLAKKHGLRYNIIAKESDTWVLKMYLLEFLNGSKLKEIPDNKIYHWDNWIDHHFNFIEGGMLDFKKIMDLAAKDKVDLTWIDPYNALFKPQGINDHQYDYEIIRLCNEYKKTHGSIDISIHPVTELNRMVISDKEDEFKGYPQPARKWHSEGGGKWQNGVDQFLCIHRFTSHPEYWNRTRLYVDKVRVTQTGGAVTPENNYIIFEYNKLNCRFTVNGVDAMNEDEKDFFEGGEEIVF
jgi:hypothetical protein